LTQLIRALSTQTAPATPAPSAVVADRTSASTTDVKRVQDAAPPAAAVTSNAPKTTTPELAVALKAAAEQIEQYLKSTGRELNFSIDEDTGQTVVTVRDASTGDVIRQMPNEEALRLAKALSAGTSNSALVDTSI
jgi:flagellar protein FlaG